MFLTIYKGRNIFNDNFNYWNSDQLDDAVFFYSYKKDKL